MQCVGLIVSILDCQLQVLGLISGRANKIKYIILYFSMRKFLVAGSLNLELAVIHPHASESKLSNRSCS